MIINHKLNFLYQGYFRSNKYVPICIEMIIHRLNVLNFMSLLIYVTHRKLSTIKCAPNFLLGLFVFHSKYLKRAVL